MEAIENFMNYDNGKDTYHRSISQERARQYLEAARILDVDLSAVGIFPWIEGVHIEFEHGRVNPLTNVTDDDVLKTAKIALAHILELPDYYETEGKATIPAGASLRDWERAKEKRWEMEKKPKIINERYWLTHTVHEQLSLWLAWRY